MRNTSPTSTQQPLSKRNPGSRSTVLVSLQQLEAEYGVPYTSWRDLVIRGDLPVVKLGGTRRLWVKRADVVRLIEAGTDVGVK